MSNPETSGSKDYSQTRFANALKGNPSVAGFMEYWGNWLTHWDNTHPTETERRAEEAQARQVLKQKIESRLREPSAQARLVEDLLDFSIGSAEELHLEQGLSQSAAESQEGNQDV